MFTITAESYFFAWHTLKFSDGTSEPAHSHNWQAVANLTSEELDEQGMVMDFIELKNTLKDITDPLNGSGIDKLEYFKSNNPTAENVAKYIYQELKGKVPKGVFLKSIRVREHTGCYAEFSE